MELAKFQVIDLTHPISSVMPQWPGDPPTASEAVTTLETGSYNLNKLTTGEHSGTHIGVPRHFQSEGQDVAHIPAKHLIKPVSKINIARQSLSNVNYLLQPKNIFSWERANGQLQRDSVLLVETGWSRYWDDQNLYFGIQSDGMHFPGLSRQATKILLERGAAGIGIDTAGVDGGQSESYPANRLLMKCGGFHLENLTNLDKVPESGGIIFIGALPIIGGSGSPCRILVLV